MKKEPYGSMEVWYKGKRSKLPVYVINMDYLIYNQYNGRIASYVKSYEMETGHELDPTNEDDVKQIEKFLKDSSPTSNKATKKSIKEQGQLKYGIVTKDGVIIDGNRRSMTIREIAREDHQTPVYFLAVVLEEALDDNPKEIMRLETTYQMGEDAKVDYNPIEKYLKCKDLRSYEFTEEEIAKMMGDPVPKIKKFIGVMELMDDYLNKLGYKGIYTRLDKTEGAFWDLYDYLTRYEGNSSKIIQWKYDEDDINDLKLIYFDYIRGIYNRGKSGESGDSKDYRFIGQTSKKGSFFSNKDVWEKFRDRHFENIDKINENEPSIQELRKNNPTQDVDQLLKNKDAAWATKADAYLKKNMGLGRESLDNLNRQNEPLELLESAYAKLESINIETRAFLDDERVSELVNAINGLTYEFKKTIKNNQSN